MIFHERLCHYIGGNPYLVCIPYPKATPVRYTKYINLTELYSQNLHGLWWYSTSTYIL